MAYEIELKQRAISLRESGYSIKGISRKLHIAISTSSVWLRNVVISPSGYQRMKIKKEDSRYSMSQKWIKKRKDQYSTNFANAQAMLQAVNLKDQNLAKVLCSILFWAEGNKDFSHIRFTNSDPEMITTFLSFFRRGYNLDERKFRACIHLHEYHNYVQIHNYWSSITGIPLNKFRKAYLKPHTGIRKKDQYKGCITIYYFDSSIAHQLEALYNAISSSA